MKTNTSQISANWVIRNYRKVSKPKSATLRINANPSPFSNHSSVPQKIPKSAVFAPIPLTHQNYPGLAVSAIILFVQSAWASTVFIKLMLMNRYCALKRAVNKQCRLNLISSRNCQKKFSKSFGNKLCGERRLIILI